MMITCFTRDPSTITQSFLQCCFGSHCCLCSAMLLLWSFHNCTVFPTMLLWFALLFVLRNVVVWSFQNYTVFPTMLLWFALSFVLRNIVFVVFRNVILSELHSLLRNVVVAGQYVEDQMFLKMQEFDFENLIALPKFRLNFDTNPTKFAQIQSVLPKKFCCIPCILALTV